MATISERVIARLHTGWNKIHGELKDKPEVSSATSLYDDLGFDSLDVVEFEMALEEEFGIVIEDADALPLQTVGDFIKYIEGRSDLKL